METIAENVNLCLRSFQKCLKKSSLLHPQLQALIEDQSGRFSAWTANSGASARGRASMDHRLREAIEARSMVMELLEAFVDRIESYMYASSSFSFIRVHNCLPLKFSTSESISSIPTITAISLD